MDVGLFSYPEQLSRLSDLDSSQSWPSEVALDQHKPIEYFRNEIAKERPWASALLETIGLWTVPQEYYQGRIFRYLVGEEAFDWLMLAERILCEVPEVASTEDREALLFKGVLPPYISLSQFKAALGLVKYRAHLSFYYGVTVEEALIYAVELETLKSRRVRGLNHSFGVDDLVMERLYGFDLRMLLRLYHRHYGRRPRIKHSLNDWKEFLYWLFKLRLKRSDASKMASDTMKGIKLLESIDALARSHEGTFGLSITSTRDVGIGILVTTD